MAEPILPSEASRTSVRWSGAHHRLHRHLRRHPELLPAGAPLLLAISGGQDSMAMLGLLRDLQPLHGWILRLWHGDHGWRAEGSRQAEELAAWARAQGLVLNSERPQPGAAIGNREAWGRHWRYGCLARQALQLGCRHVLTAHTASDRAETVLLNLARGSHRRGLASLRSSRPLACPPDPQQPDPPPAQKPLLLVRPLLPFTRAETAAICQQLALPIWLDPSNDDARLSRNRVRTAVLPVLEALHPGASLRISAQAERLAAELEQPAEFLDLALTALAAGPDPDGTTLSRPALQGLSAAGQRQLLLHWLARHTGRGLDSQSLELLLSRLGPLKGPGGLQLANRWQLVWERTTLRLIRAIEGHG